MVWNPAFETRADFINRKVRRAIQSYVNPDFEVELNQIIAREDKAIQEAIEKATGPNKRMKHSQLEKDPDVGIGQNPLHADRNCEETDTDNEMEEKAKVAQEVEKEKTSNVKEQESYAEVMEKEKESLIEMDQRRTQFGRFVPGCFAAIHSMYPFTGGRNFCQGGVNFAKVLLFLV
jgi:hypothetical protein